MTVPVLIYDGAFMLFAHKLVKLRPIGRQTTPTVILKLGNWRKSCNQFHHYFMIDQLFCQYYFAKKTQTVCKEKLYIALLHLEAARKMMQNDGEIDT